MAWIEGPKCSLGSTAHRARGCKGKHAYRVRWREPQPPHKTVTKVVRTASEAKTVKVEVERLLNRNEYSPAAERRVRVEDYVARVIESDTRLSESTRYSYRVRARKWLDGTPFGQLPIDRVTPTIAREYLAGIQNGPWSRGHLHRLLRKTFRQAVRDRTLTFNPLDGIPGQSNKRAKEIVPLPVPVIEKVARYARNEMYALAFRLGAYAGMRPGEVCGLRVQDVDEVRARLRIVQATARVGGKVVLTEPKTAGSRRTIQVPRFLIEQTVAFVKDHGATEDGRIFRTARGGYLDHIRLTEELKNAAVRAGFDRKDFSFHLLRHSAVSLLVGSGATPREVQYFVGHSSITMTLGTYAHLWPTDAGAIAERMESLREAALEAEAQGEAFTARRAQRATVLASVDQP